MVFEDIAMFKFGSKFVDYINKVIDSGDESEMSKILQFINKNFPDNMNASDISDLKEKLKNFIADNPPLEKTNAVKFLKSCLSFRN